MHFPSQKHLYAGDIPVARGTTIFATGKAQITVVSYFNTIDQIKNEIMAAKWKVFEFSHQI